MLDAGTRHSRRITLGECSCDGRRLKYRDRLYVPEYEPLRFQLLRMHHEAAAAGHPGRSKTLELLKRTYYWPKIQADTDRFVRNCLVCQCSHTVRHAPFGILCPLPIPDRPWQDIAMDFVTGLPWSRGYDAIWVVIDRLTKACHLVPCRTTVDAADLADMFIEHVFCLHGLPNSIVFDRGPLFAAVFWQRLCNRLGIDGRLSTAFHPESDGQTKRVNAVMEQYLRAHVTYLQDNWANWLPLAELATNNQASEITGVSPFFGIYGQDPRWQCYLTPPAANDADDRRAHTTARVLREIHEHLWAEMGQAQERYTACADRRRVPATHFLPGDLVWLNARNIVTRHPSRKLDHRPLGPFEVIANHHLHTPYAVRLRLPETMRIHPIFHVSILEHAADDPFPGQRADPPPPVVVDGEEEYHVAKILDYRTFGRWRKLQYLVRWVGYNRPTWEDATGIEGLQAIDRCHALYPGKAGPLPERPDQVAGAHE